MSNDRYIDQGRLQIAFLPSIADTGLEPTEAEIAAGTFLHGDTNQINGFSVESSTVDTPDGNSRFVGQTAGTIKAAASSLVIYHKKSGNPLRATLDRDEEGFIVFFPNNPVEDGDPEAGDVCDVFPVTVTSKSRTRAWGDNASVWTAQFAISAEPQEDLTVSA